MTEDELKVKINQLPNDVRTKIYNSLAEAYLEINHAECILLDRNWINRTSDLPILLQDKSLNENLLFLSKLFI